MGWYSIFELITSRIDLSFDYGDGLSGGDDSFTDESEYQDPYMHNDIFYNE